ncbi:hypothetical protein Syun_010323 [Stephania yunnanensis]|uniref:Uncharacterized protein n=1 Tax=Stephania yunnanensis TaxID=152371 RepID=A0AAP0KI42_9MAGN
MSSKGGSLSAIYPGRDREMNELWDTVGGADSEDDQEGVRTMDDDNFIDDNGVDPGRPRGSLEILLAAIQTESRHGNKKESDILMARQKTLFVGCTRFTNLSKITCSRLLTSTRIRSGVKINIKHLVPYYGDTSDDANSRANSVHPGENDEDNDEVQELVANSWKNRKRYDSQHSGGMGLLETAWRSQLTAILSSCSWIRSTGLEDLIRVGWYQSPSTGVIGEIMPPRGTSRRIEELLDRHMDRILPFERTDYVGSTGRWRDSHHGSREFVRWGSEDLRRPSGHSKRGMLPLIYGGVQSGVCAVSCGKRSARRESGFRPSALRGGDGKYYARGGVQPKVFHQRDGEEGTVRSKAANVM